jgi:hypothetical protein
MLPVLPPTRSEAPPTWSTQLLVNKIKASTQNATGQSAVEFVFIAPVLFLIFFGVLQLFYSAFVSFAIQRAAFSIAQEAATSMSFSNFDPRFQIVYALFPLEKINSATLNYALATQCNIKQVKKTIQVNVLYPMPIWVPVMGNLIGQNFANAGSATLIPASITNLLQTIGINLPNLNSGTNNTKVLWINYSAECLDENVVSNQAYP